MWCSARGTQCEGRVKENWRLKNVDLLKLRSMKADEEREKLIQTVMVE